jgi:hypothetical protein
MIGVVGRRALLWSLSITTFVMVVLAQRGYAARVAILPVNERPRSIQDAIHECIRGIVDGDPITDAGALEGAVRKPGAERVLFGTDFPLCDLNMAAYKLGHAGLTEGDQ